MFKLLAFIVFFNSAFVYAFNVEILANNKESRTKVLKKKDLIRAKSWKLNHELEPILLKNQSIKVLQTSLDRFVIRNVLCDLGLIKLISEEAVHEKVITQPSDLEYYLVYLRDENIIDDIFYGILRNSNDIFLEINQNSSQSYRRPLNLITQHIKDSDLEVLFEDFKTWPDEETECSTNLYLKLSNNAGEDGPKNKNRYLKKINYLALTNSIIDNKIYDRLEILRTNELENWTINADKYLEIIQNAKDTMVIGLPELNTANDFSTKYESRKNRLTERGRLYQYFNSTQIIMLAQVIEKAGKRREAQNVTLNFDYSQETDEQESYVLSPMEKYRLSIKMLRNDLAQLMHSDNFQHTTVQYEDLISAAFETGLIKSEELDHILKFEELWNPKTPKWKSYANFAFSIAGTASFYLPSPYSILGAIALVFTQTSITNKKKKPNAEDSWNIII